MSPQQKQTLYTEVAKLIEAGFGINDAAEALLEAGQESEIEKVLVALKSSSERGSDDHRIVCGRTDGAAGDGG